MKATLYEVVDWFNSGKKVLKNILDHEIIKQERSVETAYP